VEFGSSSLESWVEEFVELLSISELVDWLLDGGFPSSYCSVESVEFTSSSVEPPASSGADPVVLSEGSTTGGSTMGSLSVVESSGGSVGI